MELRCPYCQFVMVVQGVRAGRFTPRCAQCKEKFALTIPEGENAVPRVKAIPKPADATLPPAESVIDRAAGRSKPPLAATIGPGRPAATVPPPAQTAPPPAAARVAPKPAVRPPVESIKRTDDIPVATPVEDDADTPTSLGGYLVSRKLGQGGMGAVYLARQVSLDRDVAVKVLAPNLANDPGFVARFTREAYAAAQLVHHNVVQVYDIGEDRGRHFYSMEFVPGSNLAALVARDGKLDPETAVAYTLQAARGLKYAHDRGLIHRDVKPDNLMLNDQGIVKVADLGLVKKFGVADVPGSGGGKLDRAQSADVTGFNLSMGTPAYMSPEQARDAAHVDHRADIYSLGCTLYDLLTGQPPFTGKTAMEVMTKHVSEPITPPDVISHRVPKEVSALLMRMVAKRPEDRYANIGQCILAMEDFLGTNSTGPFTPKEEHAAALESAVQTFRTSTLAQVARWTPLAFYGVIALLTIGAALLGEDLASRIVWTGSFIGIAGLTTLAYVLLAGFTSGHAVLKKLRPLVFGMGVGDWVRTLLLIGVGVMVLNVFGLLAAWAVVACVSVGLAAAYLYGLLLIRDRQRRTQVEAIEDMLRSMRLRGLDEDTLRQFVCRYSGTHWEEFYEALFGYDAKLDARRRWGQSLRGKARPKFGVWRDAIIAWADRRVIARKNSRERRLLAKTEEARMESEGVDLLTARKKAKQEAAAMVRQATIVRRQTATLPPAAPPESSARSAATTAPAGPVKEVKMLLRTTQTVEDDEPVEREHESDFARRGGVMGAVFGTTLRFPVALVLLALFFLWFRQNNPNFPNDFGKDIKSSVDNVITDLQRGDPTLKGVAVKPVPIKSASSARDLKLALLPETARHQLSGYGVGLAGILLLASCFFRSVKMGVFALAGTAVIVFGDLFIPGIAGLSPAVLAAAGGTAVFALGFVVGREA